LFTIKAQIDGVKDMLAALDGLKKAVRNRILKRAVNKGIKIILKAAKGRAPRESGLLKKSLGSKVKVYRSSGVVVGIVGPRKGFKGEVVRKKGRWFPVSVYSDPVRYAHLVELGTSHAPAKPFLGPAVTGSRAAIRNAMAEEIRKGLEAQAAKGK
jgi:HK97 gp10 family phage protein